MRSMCTAVLLTAAVLTRRLMATPSAEYAAITRQGFDGFDVENFGLRK
jgi:hypothetical protein